MTDRSEDFVEGVGGASGDAANGGDGDPGFIEPQAMPGGGTRRPAGDADSNAGSGGGSGESAADLGGRVGEGGGGGGGRFAGGAPPAMDEGAAPTGTLEVEDSDAAGNETGDEPDDFLDAPVVLDMPATPGIGTDGNEPGNPASLVEADGELPREPTVDAEGGSPTVSPPNRSEPGIDGLREDVEIDGAIGPIGGPGDPISTDTAEGRASAAESANAPASNPQTTGAPSLSDAAPDAATMPLRERLAVPEVDLAPIETTLELRDARSREAPRDDPAWLLRGAWEQIGADRNGADFAPGGYDRNVIAIDPREGVLEVYRVFRGGLVVAGAFGVEILPEGTLLLVADERLPHRFSGERIELAGGVAVEPPIEPIELSRRWRLADGVLEIEGRRFARIDREAFERISRGEGATRERSGTRLDGGTAPVAGAGDGDREGDDGDANASVDFFGTSIVGRYICYVVDISGSMAGPRLAGALDELARSIRALPPDRSFYVLFFSGGKLVLEDRWQRATSGRKRAFTSRFVDIEAQGGTEPRAALEHAFSNLAPVPDEIHLMTDGQIPGNTPALLGNLNGGRIRTVIHTYAFGDSSGAAVLERIAAEHGGTYRFVPDPP